MLTTYSRVEIVALDVDRLGADARHQRNSGVQTKSLQKTRLQVGQLVLEVIDVLLAKARIAVDLVNLLLENLVVFLVLREQVQEPGHGIGRGLVLFKGGKKIFFFKT